MDKYVELLEAEIECFERIRVFEIDKFKKELDAELQSEKSKFLKNRKKISQIETVIKEKQNRSIAL